MRDRAVRPCKKCPAGVRLFYLESARRVLPFDVEPVPDPTKGGYGIVTRHRQAGHIFPVVAWVPASRRDPELVVYRKHICTKEPR